MDTGRVIILMPVTDRTPCMFVLGLDQRATVGTTESLARGTLRVAPREIQIRPRTPGTVGSPPPGHHMLGGTVAHPARSAAGHCVQGRRESWVAAR
jgi:hypothetical protein